VDIDNVLRDRWKERFEALVKEEREEDGIEWKFVIVDGFLLYWDPVSSGGRRRDSTEKLEYILFPNAQECVSQYDVRVFLRVPHDLLKSRREERAQYITQSKYNGKFSSSSARSSFSPLLAARRWTAKLSASIHSFPLPTPTLRCRD
jgi:hypothetical protein